MNKIFLSVVIPCFDEMANLQKGVLQKIDTFLKSKKYDYEVIIIDDGSTDGSIDYLAKFTRENKSFHLITNKHLGKAGAVTTGMLKGSGEYILFTDMDQATPIEEVDNLVRFFKEGFDIVIGSRSIKRKGSPFTRVVMSRAVIILRKMLIGMHDISDTQCGFKAFKQDVAKKLFTRIKELNNGFTEISGAAVTAGFDIELLYIAKKMGYSIKEVPVTWLYVETRRVNPIKDSIEGLKDLLLLKIHAMSGRYNV